MSAGKGDKPRPINKKIYDRNYESIEWQKNKPTNPNVTIKFTKGKTTYKY